MTPTDLNFIRSTFAAAAKEPDRFAIAFRARALAIEPGLARLIPIADRDGAARVFDALASVVEGLDTAECRAAKERAFALHHRWVGLQPRHFAAVGQAFLDALGLRLGPAFDDAARTAWAQAFVVIAESLMARCYNPLDLVA